MAKPISLKELAAQMKRIESRIGQLEKKREQMLKQVDAIDEEIASLRGGRGPGRPPKRLSGRLGAAKKPRRKGPGLTDFVRSQVKNGSKKVSVLAAAAQKAGYQSGNIEQVIRLMVGKAADLTRKPDDTIVRAPGGGGGAAKKK